jgi:hypothetical protein
MNIKKTLHGLTWAFRNELDKGITLNLLKCFRHFAQAAARIACAVVSVLGILFISAANAVAPIHDGIQIQQSPKAYAKAVLPIHEYKCALELYTRESNWRPNAKNGSHYGIPQGNSIYLKTASPIEQIKWGIKYNKNRYGSNCAALRFFQRNNYH